MKHVETQNKSITVESVGRVIGITVSLAPYSGGCVIVDRVALGLICTLSRLTFFLPASESTDAPYSSLKCGPFDDPVPKV